MFRRWLREWYTLSKTQRRGTLVLLCSFLIVFLIKWLYRPLPEKDDLYFAQLTSQNLSTDTSSNTSLKKDSLFFFNPNTISAQEMKALGFSQKLISNVLNYRNAGGKFYSKESLKKLYAINDSIYQKIEPYILLNTPTSDNQTNNKNILSTPKTAKNRTWIELELNSADSSNLETLKGIGKKLSKRIIKFRTRLGGFYTVEQLKEVYGISDSLYRFILSANKITVDTNLIQKINLNTADFKTMIKHPYFNKDIIFKTLNLQKQKEKLTEEKLKHLIGDEEAWKKIKHYINW